MEPGDRQFEVRACAAADDHSVRLLIRSQMEVDPGWPPAYARKGDLIDWLAAPASLGRWVAIDDKGTVAGHVGLGAVRSGAVAGILQEALDCDADHMAEVCRIVVDPRFRGQGLSGLLTRKALRASIEAGLVPVASVLSNRGSWLTMMLSTGWRQVGQTVGRHNSGDLVVLIPAPKFVEAALRAQSPT